MVPVLGLFVAQVNSPYGSAYVGMVGYAHYGSREAHCCHAPLTWVRPSETSSLCVSLQNNRVEFNAGHFAESRRGWNDQALRGPSLENLWLEDGVGHEAEDAPVPDEEAKVQTKNRKSL